MTTLVYSIPPTPSAVSSLTAGAPASSRYAVRLPTDVRAFFRTRAPTTISILGPSGRPGLTAAGARAVLTIPPLNTDIVQYAATAPPSTLSRGLVAAAVVPENFRWQPGALIGDPVNQGTCGDCYIISITTSIQDCVSILRHQKTYLDVVNTISCYPNCQQAGRSIYASGCASTGQGTCSAASGQTVTGPNGKTVAIPLSDQCGGGSPYSVALFAQEAGVPVTTAPVAVSGWCAEQCRAHTKVCEINAFIPPCPGKASTTTPVVRVQRVVLNGIQEGSTTLNQDLALQTFSLKQHIMHIGPVVGQFLVFKNLLSGRYTSPKNPEGVYLENVDYATTTDQVFSPPHPSYGDDPNPCVGGHAVSILGWGIATVSRELIPHLPSTTETVRVPYWYCRNSWGPQWGEGGCFKVAMYPYNLISQFDVIKRFYPTQQSGGGIVSFEIQQ